MRCRDRGIEPRPLASFRRWKELGRHVRKGEKALTPWMSIQIKCKDWDQKQRGDGLAP
jgi:isopentenyldiphosphate isomerase